MVFGLGVLISVVSGSVGLYNTDFVSCRDSSDVTVGLLL